MATHKYFIQFLLATSLIASQALAQFDDFGGENVNPPPPGEVQPPATGGGAPSGSGLSGRGSVGGGAPGIQSSGAKGDLGVLNQKQRDKFARAPIEDINSENFPEIIESFDFPNADLQDIVKAISELTGKNFILDQGVRGKITIIAPTKITVAEAYKAFLSALAINGFALVPSGSFFKIRSARLAQRDSIDTYSGAYFPNSDQMITRIIHLKHVSADLINRDLRILVSKDGELAVYAATNSLIISDYGANIERVMKIINQIDVPGFEDQLEVIPIKFARAKDIADLVDKIVNKGDKSATSRQGGAFSSGVPRFSQRGTTGTQGSAYYMVIPDDRTNALIVVGNKAGILKIKKLISQLDFRMRPEDAGGVNVYYVRYGEAEKIAQTLQAIAKDGAPKTGASAPAGGAAAAPAAGGPVEIFGGDVKITADKGTNSLVIVASKQDYEVVLSLLSKIDIPRDQVFVEAIIMEMAVTDASNWNVGVFNFIGKNGAKIGFNGFGAGGLTELLNPAGGSGAILGFASGDTVEITPPGATTPVKINSTIGFVNFLKTNSQANVLSTPQLLALDNQEAEIEVGDRVVTSVTTTQGTNGAAATQSANFEDATIKLKVKPFISPASNSIRMELTQSVKQPSNARTPKALQETTQPLGTRMIKTQIVVANGDTAVLGGLMKENEVESIRKVPLLGDIPVIGWLFKSRDTSKEKTNMIVFLTPTIIRSPDDTKQLLGKKVDQRLNFIKSIGGRDPFGATIDGLQKKEAATEPGQESETK